MVPPWHAKWLNGRSICHWNKRIWNFTNLVENSVDFFFPPKQRTKQRLVIPKAKFGSKEASWNCSQWTINHSAHAQLCSTAWKKSFWMAVSLSDSCGCVCQRGSYCCLLAVLSTWYARKHTFQESVCVCYIISHKTSSQPPGKLLLEYWRKEIKMKYYVW